MKLISLTCLCFFSCITPGRTQINPDNITSQWLGWYHLEGLLGISPKWETVLELEDRRYQFISSEHQYLARLQVHYKLSDAVTLGSGFAYFGQAADSLTAFDDPLGTELRPHQQVLFEKENSRHTWSFRFRLEERFFRDVQAQEINDSYDFNFRLRFRPQWTYALAQRPDDEGALVDLVLYDEVMINAGTDVNLFNQNRIYGGFHIHLSKSASLETGFLHSFQLRDSGDRYWNRNIIRLAFTYQWQLY
jgi:hypothetical protein